MGRQSFCREKSVGFLRQRRGGMQGGMPCQTSILRILSLSYPCPHHRGRRRQVFESHIRTGEVTALPITQVEPQGTTFTATDPIGACWSCSPLLRLDAVGWALMSVASTIRTSGSGASGGSAELDADNSEKINSETPLSHQRWKRL